MLRRVVNESLRSVRRGVAAATGASLAVLRRVDRALIRTAEDEDDPVRQLQRLLGLAPEPRPARDGQQPAPSVPTTEQELRERFAVLLSESRSPVPPEGAHPAVGRIVSELCPDEARIVRLLHEEGPQPIVALRASPLIGRGEETVLDNVSLLGDRAGCHRPEDGPAYLDNLQRLGVVRLLPEELAGHDDYDAITSRPEVATVEREVVEQRNQRARVERGHVRLSHLGERLCEVCLR